MRPSGESRARTPLLWRRRTAPPPLPCSRLRPRLGNPLLWHRCTAPHLPPQPWRGGSALPHPPYRAAFGGRLTGSRPCWPRGAWAAYGNCWRCVPGKSKTPGALSLYSSWPPTPGHPRAPWGTLGALPPKTSHLKTAHPGTAHHGLPGTTAHSFSTAG